MKQKLIFLSICISIILFIQSDFPAYKIYNQQSKSIDFQKMIKEAQTYDVILFGELHDNPVAHWLQFELTKALFEIKGNQLLLGAEMFESDDQIKINEYFINLISQSSFEKECRLWPNYKTDYKPLLEFAKSNNLKFIATNIPRRYASFVSKNGIDSLINFSKHAKMFMAPLPIDFDPELKGYKDMMGMGSHAMPFIAQAQAVKDATMAHFILLNLKEGHTFLHFHGAYHSNNFEGIYWYLKKQKPELKILTISTVEQEDIHEILPENDSLANYIIVTDKDFTKTY